MILSRSSLRSAWKREEGTALLETAVSLVTVMWLVFGLFELCMFVYTAAVLNYATAVGVRYAIMHGTDSSDCSGPDSTCTDKSYANVKSAVDGAAALSLHNVSAVTVTVNYGASTAKPGNPVTVTLVYTYVPFTTPLSLQKTMTFISKGEIIF